jgi:acyl-CoA thioester hydrolase
MQTLSFEKFPLQTFDKLRYADTDRQGHVNNAYFSTFLETGRVELLYRKDLPLLAEGCSFVIASLNLQFIRELVWPGRVEIGTGIVRIGNSSVTLFQQLFQKNVCVASAETVIVQVNDQRGGSERLSDAARKALEQWLLTERE